MQDEVTGIINNVRALAEITDLYRKTLLKRGVPKREVIQYTKAFVAGMMMSGGGKNGQA